MRLLKCITTLVSVSGTGTSALKCVVVRIFRNRTAFPFCFDAKTFILAARASPGGDLRTLILSNPSLSPYPLQPTLQLF
jgi:hypothetical protein